MRQAFPEEVVMAGKTERDTHEASPKKPPEKQDRDFARQEEGLMGITKPGADKESVQKRQAEKAKAR
jgi:hypothetical protein